MTWWPCLVYVLGIPVAGRIAYVMDIDRPSPNPGDDRDDALAMSLMIALIWPIVAAFLLVIGGTYLVWSNTVGRETPGQRRERLIREAHWRTQEAERLSKEYGLPGIHLHQSVKPPADWTE